ncbi:unnamed protein product [Brachionus calyciflorus]|uniref:Transcription initiation factor TFIID subunit 9 n=1 Tax=Brachionus calyciflorus TaxID=104777 RepID=A0A814B7L4_9BILA|nr:unnamed protein product [Brachionus calyciflorus]
MNSGGSSKNPNQNGSNDKSEQNVLYQSKDAQTMIAVLKDMGIEDFEHRVISQLLEFSYRYTTNLLDEAKAFSTHAGKKTIDSEDIKMAIRSKVDFSFTSTPPRDLIMEISKTKNKNPLPPIKDHSGIRLPPDRFCLHAPNFLLKTQEHQYQPVENVMPQQRQPFQVTQTTVPQRIETGFNSIPVKRPRDDEEDYDI